METKTPDFPAARRAFRGGARERVGRLSRRVPAVMLALSLPLAASMVGGVAGGAAPGPVTVKGKTIGATRLLNPVWNEAKDPKLHRFTFREPSATVRAEVRTLTAFLPKELCIAALVPGEGKPNRSPLRVVVAGGRTSPVTLVVAPGQQIQFENQDPFAHKLYVVGADSKGFAPVETGSAKSRTWTPPGPGKYEIRDQMEPSVRSWIVVEPHWVNVGYPDRKGDFQIDLEAGTYMLRGYFNGEPVGSELPVTVAPLPVEQVLKAPLVVGEGEGAPAPPPPVPGKLGKRGGGG
jgi:plastocyanin